MDAVQNNEIAQQAINIFGRIRRHDMQALYDEEVLENIIQKLNSMGYINLSYLGEGAFGIVLKAKSLELVRFVAIKIVKMTPLLEQNSQNLNDEIQILKKIQHPNILEYIQHETHLIGRKKFRFLISQLCDGSLEEELLLLKQKNQPMNEKTKFKIILSILEAMSHIHMNQVIHRDIKASNILMKDGEPIIADFGQSRFCDETLQSMKGTPIFTAPEVFQQKYTFSADIYSLGIVFLMIDNPSFNYEDKQSCLAIHSASFQSGIIPDTLNFNKTSFVYQSAQRMINLIPEERKNIQFYIDETLSYCQSNKIDVFLKKPLKNNNNNPNQFQNFDLVSIEKQNQSMLPSNMSSGSYKSLKKRLEHYQKNPIQDIQIKEVIKNNVYFQIISLKSNGNTLYGDQVFDVELEFAENFPFKAPKMTFITPIFHIGIYLYSPYFKDGFICCCFTEQFEKEWAPINTHEYIVRYLQMFLTLQTSVCGCNEIYNSNPNQFHQMVKLFKKYKSFDEARKDKLIILQ